MNKIGFLLLTLLRGFLFLEVVLARLDFYGLSGGKTNASVSLMKKVHEFLRLLVGLHVNFPKSQGKNPQNFFGAYESGNLQFHIFARDWPQCHTCPGARRDDRPGHREVSPRPKRRSSSSSCDKWGCDQTLRLSLPRGTIPRKFG